MKILFASAHARDPQAWIQPLQQALPDAQVTNWQDGDVAQDADIAVVWNPPRTLLQRETKLRALFNLGAGVDALLKLPGLTDDMPIYRLEDAGMAVQMAEYAVWAVVRASRGFDQYRLQQSRQQWQRLQDIERGQWPVGVLGMGLMGQRVAQTLAALDYPVAGWSRSVKNVPGVESFAGQHALDEFLSRTRILINLLPLTDGTRHILCRHTFEQLQPGSHVVNLGRGGHLAEPDLIAMLDAGHLHSATLDVFQTEPLPADHPFWTHPAITVTPHVAAATLREDTIRQIAGKIRALMQGQPVSGRVTRERGY